MPSMSRKQFLLPQYQIALLKKYDDLPEAEHVRRALDDYFEKMKESTSASSSVRTKHGYR